MVNVTTKGMVQLLTNRGIICFYDKEPAPPKVRIPIEALSVGRILSIGRLCQEYAAECWVAGDFIYVERD